MATTPPPPAGPEPETPPAPPFETTGNRFFSWMRGVDIRRQDGWIGGVAGGLAVRLGIDPLIVRGILVVLALFGAPVILVYAAAWLLLPDLTNKIHLEEALAGRFEAPLAGIAAVFIVAFVPTGSAFWFIPNLGGWTQFPWESGLGRGIWTIALIAGLIWFFSWIARRSNATVPSAPVAASASTNSVPGAGAGAAGGYGVTEPPAPPTQPSSTQPEDLAAWRASQAEWKAQHNAWRNQQASAAHQAAREQARAATAERTRIYTEERERSRPHHLVSFIVVGLAIVVGALTVLIVGGGERVSAEIVRAGLGAALAVLAIGVIVNGAAGKRSGAPGAFAVPVVIAIVVSLAVPTGSNLTLGGISTYTPRDGDGSRTVNSYVVGGGSTTIDLSDYYTERAASTKKQDDDSVTLVMGGGRVNLVVPSTEHVRFTAVLGGGSVVIDGDRIEGYGGPRSLQRDFLPTGSSGNLDSYTRTIDVTVTMGGGSINVIRTADSRGGN
ncbi:MAG: PspC domain-containing protein [Microbacteriaceae bacterium]